MLWFVKSKRAQNKDDDESWNKGGVVPTLNAFDMGDTRATVIIFYGNRVDDIRMQTNVINTLQARMGTGGGNMPLACYPINTMTLGGRPDPVNDARMTLGVGDEGDPQFTISSSHPHAVATTIYEPKSAFEENWSESEIKNALRTNASKSSHAVVFSNVAPTLTAYNMDSRSPQSEESQRIVQAVHETTSVVRRLTPTECERLQGFPDGWTEGQTDGHRYKQMGNAVAVPVVEWIMERLVANDEMV